MNFVTWVYLANVIGSISIASILLMITCIGTFCAFALCKDDVRLKDEEKKGCNFFMTLSVVGIVFFAALSIFTPSKKTVYMIAGVKAVEELSNSKLGEDAADVFNDLKIILHNYAIDEK